jgi:soluble lytic murein transglycosylase-like protein
MLKNILISVCVIASLLGLPTNAIAEPIQIVNPVNLSLDEQINYFSTLYGADVSLVRKVIECESGFDNTNIGDGGLSNGILQFQRATFQRMAKLYGEDLDYQSQYDQIKLGIWALSKPELAREWSTYVAIQKGGKYSFYSKQLKGYYTVVCKL